MQKNTSCFRSVCDVPYLLQPPVMGGVRQDNTKAQKPYTPNTSCKKQEFRFTLPPSIQVVPSIIITPPLEVSLVPSKSSKNMCERKYTRGCSLKPILATIDENSGLDHLVVPTQTITKCESRPVTKLEYSGVLLCVHGLPSGETKERILSRFREFHPLEVTQLTHGNDYTYAIVRFRSSEDLQKAWSTLRTTLSLVISRN